MFTFSNMVILRRRESGNMMIIIVTVLINDVLIIHSIGSISANRTITKIRSRVDHV